MSQSLGYEFGQFKLKEGIDEAQLLAASNLLDSQFYPLQKGFISHQLISIGDGEYMDLVVAQSQQLAEEICSKWQGNSYCEAFLGLIDPESVSIKFGEGLPSVSAQQEEHEYVSA